MMKRLYLALAAAGAVLMAGVGLARCSMPAPVPLATPHPDPMPEVRAAATNSMAATATGTIKATIRRPISYDGSLSAPGASPAVRTADQETPGGYPFEEIVIEVSQAATAAANSEASASVEHIGDVTNMSSGHARLGLVALTAPGILALDYQLARFAPLSRPVLGVDLELGLDVAGNAQVGALGVTAGGKAFAGAYAWSRWDLGGQGLAAGIGLRF